MTDRKKSIFIMWVIILGYFLLKTFNLIIFSHVLKTYPQNIVSVVLVLLLLMVIGIFVNQKIGESAV